jgi:hypothetical protein
MILVLLLGLHFASIVAVDPCVNVPDCATCRNRAGGGGMCSWCVTSMPGGLVSSGRFSECPTPSFPIPLDSPCFRLD